MAGLKEDIKLHKAHAALPGRFIVVASDGSHIDVDRHHSPRLFLLNIGLVEFQYGDQPDAELTTIPTVYFGDEMQTIRSGDGRQRRSSKGRCWASSAAWMNAATWPTRVCSQESSLPVVGLVDGSLIMWGLVGRALR